MTAEYVAVFFRSHSNWDAGKVLRESHKGKKSYGEQGKKEAGVSSWADTTGLYAPAVMQEEPCLLILQDSRFQTCLAVTYSKDFISQPKIHTNTHIVRYFLFCSVLSYSILSCSFSFKNAR